MEWRTCWHLISCVTKCNWHFRYITILKAKNCCLKSKELCDNITYNFNRLFRIVCFFLRYLKLKSYNITLYMRCQYVLLKDIVLLILWKTLGINWGIKTDQIKMNANWGSPGNKNHMPIFGPLLDAAKWIQLSWKWKLIFNETHADGNVENN